MADEAGTSRERASTIKKSPSRDFEVFLNFRGPDSRWTVADELYHALDSAGVRVFLDNEEIRPGEIIAKELEEGIKKSKIYIPIFSKNYAKSKWCLRELQMIMGCRQASKNQGEEKMILPIFYDIDVSKDLKLKPESVYKAALEEYKGNVNEDVLDGWEKALKDAAKIKGRNIRDYGLAKLRELIVKEVVRKLGLTSDPEEIDDCVGMRDRGEEFINDYLKPKADDEVRVVAIYGMAGMGKTTLATHVYEKLSSDYPNAHYSLSVSKFRKPSGTVDILDLQKDLISNLLGVDSSNISDTETGVKWIKEKVKDKKVLIVLDDLDGEDQVFKLAGDISWFGIGSRIIVTTADIGIMPECEGFHKYKMPALDNDDALKLCRVAFGGAPPREGCDGEILKKAVEMSGGIPRAIRDIASKFKLNKRKLKISDLLENIEKEGLKSVNDALMISFKKLDKHQQEIFLDAACFFTNNEREDANYYWKAQGRQPKRGIMVLQNFSFIEIGDGDKLRMNRPLREFGRNLADREDIDNPENRSRLWLPEVAFEVVSENKGTQNVVALNLGKRSGQPDFDHGQFRGFKKLKFLEFDGGNFKKADFNDVFSELRWFSWGTCQPKFRTINCCFRKLVVLMLSKTQINDCWNGWDEIQDAKGLKVLKCTDCYSLKKSPDFSEFQQLKRLVFTNCPKLIAIDKSIGKLKSLKMLKLDLKNLTKLPTSIGDLAKLMHLCLWCPKLANLPKSMGNLTKLVELDISYTRFTMLPKPVMNLIRSLDLVFKHEDCGLTEEVLARLKN